MTDIVERLIEYSKDWRDRASDASVAVEAADTILALRARAEKAEAEASYAKRWANKAVEDVKAHYEPMCEQLATALQGMTGKYVELVSSVDCGFWNAEDEEVVKSSRSALATYRKEATDANPR